MPHAAPQPNVSCVVRKAFPKPRLLWYVDRVILTEQPGGKAAWTQGTSTAAGVCQGKSWLVSTPAPGILQVPVWLMGRAPGLLKGNSQPPARNRNYGLAQHHSCQIFASVSAKKPGTIWACFPVPIFCTALTYSLECNKRVFSFLSPRNFCGTRRLARQWRFLWVEINADAARCPWDT